MRSFRLLFFLLVGGVSFALSQTCQTAPAVPAGQLKMGSGKVVLDDDGVAALKGGQAVYARIKNETGIAVSYWVAVEVLNEDTKRYATNCFYRATLEPNTSAVILGSSTAEPPIQWRFSLTMAPDPDSDEELRALSYAVYSNPPKKDLPKH